MRVIDLTMGITPSIRVFPGSPQPCFIPWSKFDLQGYDSEVMFMSTHTGTHVDAPSHFAQGLESIDMIPERRLVSSALLIKISKKANQLIEIDDLENCDLKKGDSVVIATGWENRISESNYMIENPGLSEESARYLVKKNINAVAIDGPSIDAGTESKFVAHNELLRHRILIAENLCNVNKLSASRFTLVLSPLKLVGTTGSPARVFALI